MSLPIGSTPILEGKAAEEWWDKVKSEEKIPFGYIPTPELDELRKEILANAKNNKGKKQVIKDISFGELNLSQAQIFKMAKTLWDDPEYLPDAKWSDLSNSQRESFICEFILTIPKVLATVGLKVVIK